MIDFFNTYLLKNVNADVVAGDPVAGDGGAKTLYVSADSFGGGEVFIELSRDDDPNHFSALLRSDNTPVSFTANGEIRVEAVGQGGRIRARFTGSSGASNVTAQLMQ